jgi:hypothetical protein
MKRQYYHNVKCSYEGCTEYGHYSADSRREYIELCKRYSTWACVRHRCPKEVLSESNSLLESSQTVVVLPSGKYWTTDATSKPGSGFQYGPGFKAFADDFPVGTKLIITARIELPVLHEL